MKSDLTPIQLFDDVLPPKQLPAVPPRYRVRSRPQSSEQEEFSWRKHNSPFNMKLPWMKEQGTGNSTLQPRRSPPLPPPQMVQPPPILARNRLQTVQLNNTSTENQGQLKPRRPAPPPPERIPPPIPPRPARYQESFGQSPYITNLTGCTFDSFNKMKDVTLVMFYDRASTADEQGQWASDQFIKTAASTQRLNSAFGAVNCTENPSLCSRERITNYPFHKLYTRGVHVLDIQDTKSADHEFLTNYMQIVPILDANKKQVF